MSDKEALAILRQIGWDREDTKFMSLNLTDQQLAVIQQAVSSCPADCSIEQALCQVLAMGLETAISV